MTTYTNLGIKEITTGDEAGTWGTSTNTNFEYFDTAIVGYVKVTQTSPGTSGSPETLNVANFAVSDGRNRLVEFYSASDLGADSFVQITPNTFYGYYFIKNNLAGGRALNVFQGTYNAGRAIVVPSEKEMILRCEGAGAASYVIQVLKDAQFNSITSTVAIPISSGGTGQTIASAAFNALSPITNTGDLIIGNGTNSATRLAIGANGYVLTSDGTTASWAVSGGISLSTPNTWTALQTFTAGATITSTKETKVAVAASNLDLSTGNYFSKTISGTTTFTVSNVPSTGTAICLILDLTNGGSATVNWWSGVKWPGGVAPTLTTSGRDTLGFFTYDGGTTWNGFLLGKDMK